MACRPAGFGARLGFCILQVVASIAVVRPTGVLAGEAADPQRAAFEQLLLKVQGDPGGATEDQAKKLLTLGQSLGRNYAVSLAIKGYLTHNFRVSSSVLLMAGDNALLAGDFRTATARYKAYLTSTADGDRASEAAASLYMLLTDFLGATDDAYQFMTLHGEKFRSRPSARKFDAWYLDEARRRQDYAGAAKCLHLIFAQQLPLEQERLHFWEYLDWLMEEVVRGRQQHFGALPYAKKLVPVIRGDRRRTLKYALYVANLEFKAGSAGKEATALDEAFKPVVAAAKAYLDAYPTAATLKDIVYAFTDGGVGDQFDDGAWQRQREHKSTFLVYGFSKLNDADRAEIIGWRAHYRGPIARYLASPEQWAELGQRHAALFRSCEATRILPFVTKPEQRDLYAKQAQFLAGVPSGDAAVINSMAASADLAKAVDHLVRNESWHLNYTDPYTLLEQVMWPAARALAEKTDKKLTDDDYRQVLIHFGDEHLTKTPIAFDDRAARAYVEAAWDYGSGKDPNDKAQMIQRLAALQWVPYDRKARRELFQNVYQRFRNWANWVRRELRSKEPKVAQAAAKQIAPLEAAFKEALDPNAVDPNKAPNPLCKALAQVVIAEDKKDQAGFLGAARALYPLVKDYDTKKTPFGRVALLLALGNRQDSFEKIDFQLEVVADQLKQFNPAGTNERIREICDTAVLCWQDKGWWRTPKQARERTLKLNELFEKKLLELLAANQFSPMLFEWFRGTRAGEQWSEKKRGEAVMAKILEQKVFHKTAYRPHGGIKSATCSYMYLIRNEFPGLNEKHPVERGFDDMFVEEATRTGYLDWRYWDFGLDDKKSVVGAAAKILQTHAQLPFGYNDDKVVYSRSDFWNWQARALGAEKALHDAMLTAIEATYGKTRFDTYAMGRAYFSTMADPSTPEGRKEFFARLAAYLGRVRTAPLRLSPPYLGAIGKLGDPAKLTKPELDVLLSIFPECVPMTWPERWSFETLATTLAQGLIASGREAELYGLIPHFWKLAADTRNGEFQHALTKLTLDLAEREQGDLGLICASVGLEIMKTGLPDDARSSLVAARSKTLSKVGGVIPVRRDDRRYPIYAAQAAYLTGKQQTAWENYLSRRDLLLTMVKELDPAFCIWLIDKNTEAGAFDDAENLARHMIQWFDSVADGFQPEVRARLLLSYANIAFARREYPRARALYERIAAAAEFKGTRAQIDAELKVAEVDRQTNRHEDAIKRLEILGRSKDAYLQAESYYQLALVKFDQEEYREALDYVEKVFARAPDHALAKILEGRTKVKMRKLEEPTEIQVGTVTQRRFIVPGRPLKVNLEDRNLAVVGKSANIEIRAWSDSGDEELFGLMPFGDSKTRFRGQIPTELAPTKKADGTLQLLGNDVAHYDFSDAFKKEHKIALSAPQALQVATDAELLVSSGTILTKKEREAGALERLIRQRLQAEEPKQKVALSTLRPESQIKPGNRFNVRVVDPDRSATANKDKLPVRVATLSGDSIVAVLLEETDTHSGVFEGAVQTASGQAVAFASDSDDGKEPNFVISKGNYPAWVGLPDNLRPKTFSIDLNDNAALGKMKVVANVAGRKLKKLFLQTSLNGRDFTTVGQWPGDFQPWDGSLEMELVKYGKENRGPSTVADFKQYLEEGYIKENTPKFTLKPRTFGAKLDYSVAGHGDQMGLAAEREGSWYIAHFRTAFYQPVRRIRAFEVDRKNPEEKNIRYLLLVDGEGGEGTDAATKVRRSLGKGVHRIDLYVTATRKAEPQFNLMIDSDAPPFLTPAPPEMFDPKRNPQIQAGVHVEPAKIASSAEDTTFDIAFPQGARARVVRFLLADFETDAPAINKITLDDGAGQALLPTKEDFMALRKNQVLEIVPGDRITVTYQDPRVITEGQEQHEAFLTATFSNAKVSACFVEYTVDGAGERHARYISMRRFKPGDKVSVFINDPDRDVSDKPDTVKFTARTSEGKPVALPALETEEHSGVFVGGLFPVATDPKRESEVKVVEGDDVILTYADEENTDPGIPWNRTCIVEQTWYEPPELRVFDVSSRPLTDEEKETAGAGKEEPSQIEEFVPAERALVAAWPERPDPQKPASAMIHGPLIVEVVFPFIAQSPESKATVYVQTSSGRKALAEAPKGEFDIRVPGTLKLEARPSNTPTMPAPPGYKSLLVRTNPYAGDSLDDGRFSFLVPYELAKLPKTSLALIEGEAEEPPALAIKGDDEIFVGLQYKDDKGETHWATQKVVLQADAFFDLMDRRYREPLEGTYVGENAHFRVMDPKRDTSDEKDAITVALKTTSGTTKEVELTETFMHSGVFKGLVKIVYKGDEEQAKAPNALPVNYGDTVAATYQRAEGAEALQRSLLIFKGSNGDVLPFTKRFKDPEIAVQTQFAVAEAYFELAKRHRELGQDSLARREIAQGKKLLEEAIRDYPDTEARAQADYLLAELALEFANDAKDDAVRKECYAEAVSRFSDIVASYPDSPYAPKAQYKKALVFEKTGEIDQACEEYVKLSYRYPDNELVAETIARLGQYFLTKGKGIRKTAGEEADAVEREKAEIQAREMYKTAAQVFGRLAVRFPTHRLAGKTSVLSAQCYMQAEDMPKAIEVFKSIVASPKMDNELIAESMYWCGDCYMKKNDYVNAYRMFKRLTWDYPASKWAKFARGRLTEEALVNIAESDTE